MVNTIVGNARAFMTRREHVFGAPFKKGIPYFGLRLLGRSSSQADLGLCSSLLRGCWCRSFSNLTNKLWTPHKSQEQKRKCCAPSRSTFLHLPRRIYNLIISIVKSGKKGENRGNNFPQTQYWPETDFPTISETCFRRGSRYAAAA